ncbi:MAG: hypothetical protein JW923_02015 [Spirochaetales bacterium]|nr:hypothetical protein [Spirochaetales bacterium]MBP7262554.1 hypothetical protein [Spirochaetia bacterium]
MPHVVRYQDDLFLLDGLSRFLSDAARLEPDPDIAGEPVLAVARSLDSSIRRIRDLIMGNQHLVDRLDYLRFLARVARVSGDALSELARPQSALAPALASSSDELERMSRAHKAAAAELADALHAALDDGAAGQDLVSGDELSELLRD